ncbi:hypothetical protein [Calycomorphotria hydatis]|uniref:Lipocalin-like domain-containing protein n=1 Tax=Calycomorphotria hydatis TaxID=2528027 RepID=A0A517T9B1_9PLAN|nr:hypothetical protein [Calycomorphotria hydatis]QDT64960.1 hypothetical protein V22_22060 [Calycomorphotria hydatis]
MRKYIGINKVNHSASLPILSVVLLAFSLCSCSSATSAPVEKGQEQSDSTPSDVEQTAVEIPLIPVVAQRPLSASDLKLAEGAIGTWTQLLNGVRTLEIRDDGSAKLHIEFDWVTSLAFGESVTIDIAWRIQDGKVTFESISGSPQATFESISELYGTEKRRRVSELSAERFVLKNDDTGSESIWTRVEKAGTSEPAN